MRQLLNLFGEVFADSTTYSSRQPDDAYLTSLLASETFVAIAAFGAGALSIDNRAKNTAPYTEAAVTS